MLGPRHVLTPSFRPVGLRGVGVVKRIADSKVPLKPEISQRCPRLNEFPNSLYIQSLFRPSEPSFVPVENADLLRPQGVHKKR